MSIARTSDDPLVRASRRRDERRVPRRLNLIDPQTLMRIKSLQIRARVAVEGFIKGIHRSPYHGFSVEFSEYREYSPGDDPRYLDWRLLRALRSVLREAIRGRDEPPLLSRGRHEPVDGLSVRIRTAKATTRGRPRRPLPIFWPCQRDAVGLLLFEDRITEYLPARYRPGHLRRLMAALEREPAGRATDLVAAARSRSPRPCASAG